MIDMDKEYKTRDGRAVRVLCVDRKHAPAVIFLTNESEINCCSSGGESTSGPECDLIEVKPSVVFWVNVKSIDHEVIHYDSELGAIADASDSDEDWDIIARRVELQIGEGE